MQTKDDSTLTSEVAKQQSVSQRSSICPVSQMIQSCPPSPNKKHINQSDQQHQLMNKTHQYRNIKYSVQNQQFSPSKPEQQENQQVPQFSQMTPVKKIHSQQQLLSSNSVKKQIVSPKVQVNDSNLNQQDNKQISFISTQPLIVKDLSSIQLQLHQINDQQQSIDKPQEQKQSNKETEQQSNKETEQQINIETEQQINKTAVKPQQQKVEQLQFSKIPEKQKQLEKEIESNPKQSLSAKLQTKFSSSMSQVIKSQSTSILSNKSSSKQSSSNFQLPTLDLSSILKISSDQQLYEKPEFSQFSAKLIPFSQLSAGTYDSQDSSDNENFWTIAPQQKTNLSAKDVKQPQTVQQQQPQIVQQQQQQQLIIIQKQLSSKGSTASFQPSELHKVESSSSISLKSDINSSLLNFQQSQITPASSDRSQLSSQIPKLKLSKSRGMLILEPLIQQSTESNSYIIPQGSNSDRDGINNNNNKNG